MLFCSSVLSPACCIYVVYLYKFICRPTLNLQNILMRLLFCLTVGFIPAFLISQQTADKDLIEEPKYDTTSIDIKSTNSFYFCSKLYKIPRDCDKKDQSDCCSYSAQIFPNLKVPMSGQLSCYNGTSLSWTQFETFDQARSSCEGYPPQIKEQMKMFASSTIKFFICQQEVQAYKISYTTFKGHKGYQIISYATINGQHIMLQLHSMKELNSSNDLSSIFQQIVHF